jgi:hypothetical protein
VISTLNEDIADSMQLKRGSARPIGGVGQGVVMDQTVNIDNFSIGLMAGHGFHFYVQHLRSAEMAGTLAPNLLGNFDLDFDFAGGWLNLISKNPCPGSEVYWTKQPFAVIPMTIDPDSGHIQISVKVDGKEVNAIVDTGATSSVMSVGAARWDMMLDESQMKKQQTVINGAVRQTFAYPFKTIDFAGVSVTNPHILVLADRDLPVTQALLGSDVLRQLHLYISYKERKIYVTPATAH